MNRLIASLASDDVSFAKIADLIEKDTVLAGNILKLVNSALYGLAGTVNSIRHAVSLLGITKLRNAALSMSVARMWNQVKTPPDGRRRTSISIRWEWAFSRICWPNV